MKQKKSDALFIGLAFLAVLVLLLLASNLNKLFPMPDDNLLSAELIGEIMDNPEAPVIIEEYSDFQCPYCSVAQQSLRRVQLEYANEVNVVFKHFPLQNIHPNAQNAAESSECARDQGKFWQMHDSLYRDQDSGLDESVLWSIAEEIGLDVAEFSNCLSSGEKSLVVAEDLEEGLNRAVRGTPTFFINGKMLVGVIPYEQWVAEIEEALEDE